MLDNFNYSTMKKSSESKACVISNWRKLGGGEEKRLKEVKETSCDWQEGGNRKKGEGAKMYWVKLAEKKKSLTR